MIFHDHPVRTIGFMFVVMLTLCLFCSCNSNDTKQLSKLVAVQEQELESTQKMEEGIAQMLQVLTAIAVSVQTNQTSNQTVQITPQGLMSQLAGLLVAGGLFYLIVQYIKARKRKNNG